MKIAFILDHALMHYRVSFFNMLATNYDHEVVVYHSGNELSHEGLRFKQIITRSKKILRVFDYRQGISINSFDIVVCMQNIRLLNLWALSLNKKRKFRLIHWGIGVSSAKGLRSQSSAVRTVRNFLMNFADAVVFYSTFPLQFIKKSHFSKSFVALNTVDNGLAEDLSSLPKDSFIFIGSLNKRKGLLEMVSGFHRYLQHKPSSISKLFIIGEGEEYANLSEYISSHGLEDNILMLGKIENPKEKIAYFSRSIASISLNQAGLSVLESFSFGVPFITKKDAISGGEHLNIRNFENGFLVGDINDFVDKLSWIDQHLEDAKKLGTNAFSYYSKKASMDLMVRSFENAIRHVEKS